MSQNMDGQNIQTEQKVTSDNGYDVMVMISGDYYQAFVTVQVFDNTVTVTKESIMRAIAKKSITYGLIDSAINRIIENPNSADNILVAQGIPHINGIDGEVTFLFDLDSKVRPTLNVDGSVDFKNMHFLKPTYSGDLLATRSMPTEGTTGMTVTGKQIKPKPGKIKNFKIGKGVKASDDGLSVMADVSGSIQFDGEKISVLEMLEIRDDIGIKTGNIEFKGKVVIHGNVTTGFSVISDDDIIINGIVEGAEVKTRGNLYINGGVQGHEQAKIHVEGTLISKFLNSCQVYCSGNIESDAIMHCDIICDGSIHVRGKKALIVGGDINVRYDIEAKVIGSEMGTMTKLRLGVDSKIMDTYQATLDEVKELKETITKLSQASRLLTKQFEQTRNPEIKAMLDKTEVSRTDYTRQMVEASNRLKEVTDLIETLRGSKVKAEDLYPGVKIRIGNNFYNVKSQMTRVVIKRDEGDIRAVSY